MEELLALRCLAGIPRELLSRGWARRLRPECFPEENMAGPQVREVRIDGKLLRLGIFTPLTLKGVSKSHGLPWLQAREQTLPELPFSRCFLLLLHGVK